MSTINPDKILSMRLLPLTVDLPQDRKPGPSKVGRDIYEVFTNTGRHGYKQRIETPKKCSR